VLASSEVREAVERAARLFVDVCASATDEQWRFMPDGTGDRAWTLPQIVEHVTTANQGVLRLLQKVVVESPRGEQVPDFDDDDMPYLFYGGGGGAPPGLPDPSGTWSQDESITAFRESMRAIVEWYDGVDVDLRDYALSHPAFGLFDGAQWLLFAAVHARQHRGQMLNVMLASGQLR
jgi:DinB family protein